MTRAVALASIIALAAGQGLAMPTMETVPQVGEWDETAQGTTAPTVTETIEQTENVNTTNVPRMMGTQEPPQQLAAQEAVLDALMEEVQNIFKNSLTVPGWENMDSAVDAVRQIVERVRERLTSSFSETEAGRSTMTTATALRGVTNDFLKEVMVQEAVIETLWAVLRDTQSLPVMNNMNNEPQAMQTSATQAVQGFLTRMQDRLRATGFTDDEIAKMMPRAPERNLGGRRAYGYRSYGYGWGYPSYGYGWGYGYPSYSRSYWYRRLAETTNPEPNTPPTGVPPPMGEPMGPAPPPPPAPEMMPPFPPMDGPMPGSETPRALNAWGYPSFRYSWGYPSYSWGYGYPYYTRSYWYRRLAETAEPEPNTPPTGPATPKDEKMNTPTPPPPAPEMMPPFPPMDGPMPPSEAPRGLNAWGYPSYGYWGYPSYSWGFPYSYGRSYWYRRLAETTNPETATNSKDFPTPGMTTPEPMGPFPPMDGPMPFSEPPRGLNAWGYRYGWGYPSYSWGFPYSYGRSYWYRRLAETTNPETATNSKDFPTPGMTTPEPMGPFPPMDGPMPFSETPRALNAWGYRYGWGYPSYSWGYGYPSYGRYWYRL